MFLAANGVDVIIARNEQSVLSNTVFISGEFPRATSFEKGMPGQHRLDAAGAWTPMSSYWMSASSPFT
jgi:7,8-dihydropterin-6-yl-methyl-4-(beta-D-ribofuranosyl)aminobenzene 5'-phosphate synthase